MKILTEKKQKKIVKDILEQAEQLYHAIYELSECGLLSPKEYCDATSKLNHNITEIAKEIYGMKGVVMCNEKFGIGSK